LAAIGAGLTIDLGGNLPVDLANNGIDFFGVQVTGFQESPEFPIFFFFFLAAFLDFFDIGFDHFLFSLILDYEFLSPLFSLCFRLPPLGIASTFADCCKMNHLSNDKKSLNLFIP
jgi:hypothetical protein